MSERYNYIEEFTEDYYLHWEGLNVKDKRVLDLGSDWGSTAKFFYINGAKEVIGVDADTARVNNSKRYLKNFTNIQMVINDPVHIEYFILEYKPDIVKMDIEGAEINLVKCRPEILSLVSQWGIETHSPIITVALNKLFSDIGYKVYKNKFFFKESDLQVLIMNKSDKNE